MNTLEDLESPHSLESLLPSALSVFSRLYRIMMEMTGMPAMLTIRGNTSDVTGPIPAERSDPETS